MKRLLVIALAFSVSGCASYLKHIETAKGPDAYWINSVPPDVAKLEAERKETAFYNQPVIKAYLIAVPVVTMGIFTAGFAAPAYVPPVVP